jgi:hypothetical protein
MARQIAREANGWMYGQLSEIEAGFERVRGALGEFRRASAFERAELDRFGALLEEARAATVSYLLGILETKETDRAGRLYRKRRARERNEQRVS